MTTIIVSFVLLLVYTFMLGLSRSTDRFGWLAAALMSFNWMLSELQIYKLTH